MIMMLVMIIICSLVVIPVLRYATAVTRSARVQQSKSMRIEAVKGGLRTALADPISLYKSCDAAGLTVSVALAEPLLTTKVASKCYKMNDVTASDPLNLRYAVATTQVGAAVPTDSAGTAFPGSGAAPASAWQASAFVTPKLNTVWAPDLPAHGLNQRSNSGYAMPTGFATCSVYFPGTYKDPLTITGSTPVFFTSGIYYFENTVRISGNANVVVGDGGTQGCSNDQEAAFYATNAPSTHNISGLGATFVFGSTGRLVIDNVTAGNTSIVFNQRYVAATDASTLSSAGVSIESVNGVISGGDQSDLTLAGFLSVPQSRVGGATITTAVSQSYVPSTLVPTAPIAPAVVPTNPLPIIDINLSTAATVNVIIPGYVSVPQGLVNVNVASVAAAANKTIQLAGGVLAASYTVTDQRPASFVLGLLNPIIQKIFKIVTITDTSIGAPVITSTAIVQVNQNGAYAVNSWAVQ
ncbi:unannotated protein [freshwater metagenome]|uniref:Unannotated protein n=1 Tax=freshwater metagenome TaxID=449393 RepID=A0A6J7DC44_9ZZZZ|nr:hypothetical protein [Actinomycetota bacterium]